MQSCLQFDRVSKRYRIGQGFANLRSLLAYRNRSRSADYHWALKDVSFELRPGEALGIIGPNGAGKTTILKILSRVTSPTSGRLRMNGRLAALIELGAGFHPDLSGRENIYLNGTILGMRRSEIKACFDQIVAFAGIGDYLDTPVKRYSSGMYARLGFAIAAHVNPEILLVDEVLAVGDYAFQMKCYARMDDLRRNGTSLVFVSHNMEAIRRVCDKGLVMYRGEAVFEGSSAEAVIAYSNIIRKAARERETAMNVPPEDGLSQRVMTLDAEIESVTVLDATGQPATVLQSSTSATVVVDARFNKDVRQPIFSLTVYTPDGRIVYDSTTRWMNIQTPDFSAGERCRVEFDLALPLLDGEYELGVDITASDLSHYCDRLERAMGFWVKGPDSAKGLVDLSAKVEIVKMPSDGEAVWVPHVSA